MQVCTSLQTDNHANTSPLSFLQAGCPSCRPTNSVKALKESTVILNNKKKLYDHCGVFDTQMNAKLGHMPLKHRKN